VTGGAAQAGAEPAECRAKVLLTDPEANMRGVAIAPGVATAIGEAARVRVTPEPNAPRPLLAVWENRQGQFRRAGAGALPVPPGAVRLHVFAPQGENDEASVFYASLSEAFRDAPKPSFLAGKRRRKPRGVDDDVTAYQDGSLPAARRVADAPAESKPGQAAETVACVFEFSGPALGGDPSR
jgi:hypothetical protein